MDWTKKGVIFVPKTDDSQMTSHAAVPVIDSKLEKKIRVYFSSRNNQGYSVPYFIEAVKDNPKNITEPSNPILELGPMGSFDECGIMPSWIETVHDKKYLYYIGWNPQVSVSYRLSIGLAISDDGGLTFHKQSAGPILDRAIDEPFFSTAPCVHFDNGIWKMWYVSCTHWSIINKYPEPHYLVKYAESKDGIHWKRKNHICINYSEKAKSIGRPCVYMEKGIYKMIYSYRGMIDYRNKKGAGYHLGYAESKNGLDWEILDEKLNFNLSDSGWDSNMNEYASTYKHNNKRYLLYNGNGFGKTGFGYAEMDCIK
jgi:hypothetical protein